MLRAFSLHERFTLPGFGVAIFVFFPTEKDIFSIRRRKLMISEEKVGVPRSSPSSFSLIHCSTGECAIYLSAKNRMLYLSSPSLLFSSMYAGSLLLSFALLFSSIFLLSRFFEFSAYFSSHFLSLLFLASLTLQVFFPFYFPLNLTHSNIQANVCVGEKGCEC